MPRPLAQQDLSEPAPQAPFLGHLQSLEVSDEDRRYGPHRRVGIGNSAFGVQSAERLGRSEARPTRFGTLANGQNGSLPPAANGAEQMAESTVVTLTVSIHALDIGERVTISRVGHCDSGPHGIFAAGSIPSHRSRRGRLDHPQGLASRRTRLSDTPRETPDAGKLAAIVPDR